jgi:hypothetical protein
MKYKEKAVPDRLQQTACRSKGPSMRDFDAIRQIVSQYWPYVLGILAFVTAVITAISGAQSIIKNRAELWKLHLEAPRTSIGANRPPGVAAA